MEKLNTETDQCINGLKQILLEEASKFNDRIPRTNSYDEVFENCYLGDLYVFNY